jgi:hypothetical protein
MGDVVGLDGNPTVEPRADVSALTVTYGATELDVALTVPFGDDPSTSPSWKGNLSGAVAVLDVNGDDVPDYASVLFADDAGVVHVLTIGAPPVPTANGGIGLSACPGSGAFDGSTGTYALAVPSACVGNAYEVRVATVLLFNRATSLGDPIDLAFDVTPDQPGYTAAVHRDTARDGSGYRLAASDGGIFAFGSASFLGSTGGITLNKPVVGTETTRSGQGYWLVASDGGIFAYGDAAFHGSTGSLPLVQPIVAMAATPTGQGYWLVASDGGIFAFGDAAFYGSTGGRELASPVVDMAATPTGDGYWLLHADGSVRGFGRAGASSRSGSGGPAATAIRSTPSGRGYWIADAAGGVTAVGDAADHGHFTGTLAAPIVGMAVTPTGRGYWLLGRDGGIFSYGDAAFHGSTGGLRLNRPVLGMTA